MEASDRVSRRIKLRDLEILHAAAKAGSMAKAASDLAITQPAVSYAVAEIEHLLGVPLLERSSQGVAPTVYGRALLERGAVIFNELRQGVSEIAALADPTMGEVRIGTTPPMSAVASAVLNRLIGRHPRMRFELSVGGTDLLLRQLRQREIELAISRLGAWARDDDLRIETLFHDELAVICGKHNKWARRRDVALADLIAEPWLLPPADGFLTQVIRSAFEEQGLQLPQATVTTASTYALAVLAANGPFLAMHPRAMLTIPARHPQLAAVDVALPVTRAPIGLIVLGNRPLGATAKLFAQSLVRVVGAIDPRGPSSRRSDRRRG